MAATVKRSKCAASSTPATGAPPSKDAPPPRASATGAPPSKDAPPPRASATGAPPSKDAPPPRASATGVPPSKDASLPKASATELRVRVACRAVPRGCVATYGTIAKVVGTGPRAVGQFMRRNPYAPVRGYAPRLPGDPPAVPCHRVVASGGKIGGFMGDACSFRSEKLGILSSEGVEFRENGQLDREDKLVGPERLQQLLEALEEKEAAEKRQSSAKETETDAATEGWSDDE